MFDIYLKANQLVNTFLGLKSIDMFNDGADSKMAALTILKECRFVLTEGSMLDVLNDLNRSGDHYQYWCSSHLSSKEPDEIISPFSFEVPVGLESLFAGGLTLMLAEPEFFVKDDSFLSDPKWSNLEGCKTFTEEIIIYDPFIYSNRDRLPFTTRSILEKISDLDGVSVVMIGKADKDLADSHLRSLHEDLLASFPKVKSMSLLCISDVYHDREIISNVVRLRSGDSFNWPDSRINIAIKKRASTIYSFSMLKSERVQLAWEIITRIFEEIDRSYVKNGLVTPNQKRLAASFLDGEFFKYWKCRRSE